MTLFKRQPLTSMPQLPMFSQLQEEMQQLWNRDFPHLGKQWELLGDRWQLDVDVKQKDDMYIVKADIPGVEPKDIKVSMEGGNLIIEGKRESEVEKYKDEYRCIERNYGSFYRSFTLPDACEADKIKAHSHNGVLEITIPKASSAKQKKIEVKID